MDGQPAVGSWYEADDGRVFVVLAVDKASGAIDVQYLNGRVDQYDRETWSGATLLEIEPPEEWRGSMEDFFRERGRKK